MNVMFKNDKKIISLKRVGGRKTGYIIYEDGSEDKFRGIGYIKIKCAECDNFSERLIKEKYFNTPMLCFSCNKKGDRNPFYGKTHPEELKRTRSKERKGVWGVGNKNAMYGKSVYDVWVERYGEKVAKQKWNKKSEKQSLRMSGENNPFYEKTHTEENIKIISKKNKLKWKDEDYRKKQSKRFSIGQLKSFEKDPEKYRESKRNAAYISNLKQKRYKKTKPEIIFENILKDNNIEYVYSPIMGKYQYDFKIKNKRILIEVDGDYWHGNPKIYDTLNHIQEKKQIRDKEKEKFADAHNFKLYRIWDSELNDKQKIKELLNEIKTNNIN